ncbi:MAG: hypothetical protein AB8C40_10520 [Gammaproteobacteria bacterium]
MASETTASTINRYSNTFVLVGIIALGVIGLINLFAHHVGQGLGFIITSIILLRIFVWLEKAKLQQSRD